MMLHPDVNAVKAGKSFLAGINYGTDEEGILCADIPDIKFAK